MTTTLILIRHAKPEEESESGIAMDDFTQPISQEGQLIQEMMSQKLKGLGYRPNVIFCSPLVRTKMTAEILGEAFQLAPINDDNLMLHGDDLKLIATLPDPALNQTIILVGHGPSLLRLANRLVGKATPIYTIDRSGALVIRFDGEVAVGKAQFVEYVQP